MSKSLIFFTLMILFKFAAEAKEDCGEVRGQLNERYREFRLQTEKEIDYQAYDLGKIFKKMELSAEVGMLFAEYRALKEANPKSPKLSKIKTKMIKLLLAPEDQEVNCRIGPDFLAGYDPKLHKCIDTSGRFEPYEVPTISIIDSAEEGLKLSLCRTITHVPFNFKICGSRNLENEAAVEVDDSMARHGVMEIRATKKVRGASTDHIVVLVNKFDFINQDLAAMVEQAISKKYKRCAPLI